MIAKFGYDHVNYAFLVSVTGSSPPSSDAEVFSTSARYMLRNTVQAGLEAGGSLIHFTGGSNTNLSNATQWNLGSFVEARYSEHLRFRLSAGYTMYSQSENTFTTGTALSGVYGQAVISHQVSRMLDYYLYGGRVISLSYYGGTVNDLYLRLQANWHFLRKITLTTGFDYDNGSQFYTIAENFSRYGLRFAVARQITRKLTATLTYQFYDSEFESRREQLHRQRRQFGADVPVLEPGRTISPAGETLQ